MNIFILLFYSIPYRNLTTLPSKGADRNRFQTDRQRVRIMLWPNKTPQPDLNGLKRRYGMRTGRAASCSPLRDDSSDIFPELSNFMSPPAKPGVYLTEISCAEATE